MATRYYFKFETVDLETSEKGEREVKALDLITAGQRIQTVGKRLGFVALKAIGKREDKEWNG